MKRRYPPTITNEEMMQMIGDGDIVAAIEFCLAQLETMGWTWEKLENSHGAVRDAQGNLHLLWMAKGFADAVAVAYRLMLDYEKLGWC